jgi:hypothetical protein
MVCSFVREIKVLTLSGDGDCIAKRFTDYLIRFKYKM